VDRTQPARGNFTAVGRGFFEPTESTNWKWDINTSKIWNRWGQHTVGVGYTYQRSLYSGSRERSGPRFAIPDTNAIGTPADELGIPGFAVGQQFCAKFPIPLCTGAGIVNPIQFPPQLPDPLGLAPYKIYRGMKDDNGAPKVEPTARGLGARPGSDITPDENGMVHPPANPADAKGVSTAPEKPGNLPAHRRPPELGTGKGGVGTGKDPVWSLDPDKLPDGLVGIRDSPTHVTIAPSRSMPLDEYQALIASTKGLWEKVEP